MKNHIHKHHPQADIGAFEPMHPERFAAAQKSTWVSIVINLLLTFFQVVGGFFAHSQALMADGLHSLSDLLSDMLVLYANRHGNRHADANHPYGHARVETAATLILAHSWRYSAWCCWWPPVSRPGRPMRCRHAAMNWCAMMSYSAPFMFIAAMHKISA